MKVMTAGLNPVGCSCIIEKGQEVVRFVAWPTTLPGSAMSPPFSSPSTGYQCQHASNSKPWCSPFRQLKGLLCHIFKRSSDPAHQPDLSVLQPLGTWPLPHCMVHFRVTSPVCSGPPEVEWAPRCRQDSRNPTCLLTQTEDTPLQTESLDILFLSVWIFSCDSNVIGIHVQRYVGCVVLFTFVYSINYRFILLTLDVLVINRPSWWYCVTIESRCVFAFFCGKIIFFLWLYRKASFFLAGLYADILSKEHMCS